MERKLTQETLPVWRCGCTAQKQCLVTAESVVPDTLPDVGRIVWVQSGLLLKSKELRPEGLSLAGELWASVLYLREGLDGLESLRLTKPFRLDFDTPQPDPEAPPELSWRIDRTEARALNPRKIQASFAVSARLRCYERSVLAVGAALPEPEAGLHLLEKKMEVLALTGVWEKRFSLREQLPVPAGRPCPARLIGEELRFEELQAEQVGSRTVLKGRLQLRVTGLDERGLPQSLPFTLPFSQLLDTGERDWARYRLRIEPCSCYLNWTEGAAGERSLDAEIHAVAQFCVWSQVQTQFVTDGYSTRMPCRIEGEERSFLRRLERESLRLQAETSLPMPDDGTELLAAQGFWEPLEASREGSSQTLNLDLLLRTKEGGLDCARRILRLEGEALPEGTEAPEMRESLLDLRAEEGKLSLRCESEGTFLREERQTLFCVTGLSLDEEQGKEMSPAPELYLVRRREGESLWDLAKAFRSSPEAIAACNAEGAQTLLIPAET
jgi:hypothetical protein